VNPEATTYYIATGSSSCGSFTDTVNIFVEPCFGVGVSSPQNESEIPADASVYFVNELGISVATGSYSQCNEMLKEVPSGFYVLEIRNEDQILQRRKIYLMK